MQLLKRAQSIKREGLKPSFSGVRLNILFLDLIRNDLNDPFDLTLLHI